MKELDRDLMQNPLVEPIDQRSIGEELVSLNKIMTRFFQQKKEAEKLAGSKIEMAIGIYDALDFNDRPVEFIRSSSSNRFNNMVTIKPILGAEGPEERFLWSAADPRKSASAFSTHRIHRLKQAVELIDKPYESIVNG